jgi:hypothetical protein
VFRIRRQPRVSEGLRKLCDRVRSKIDPRCRIATASSTDKAKSAHRVAQGLSADQ